MRRELEGSSDSTPNRRPLQAVPNRMLGRQLADANRRTPTGAADVVVGTA